MQPDDEVIAARNEFYHRDPKGYFGKMTEETKTEIYCAEIGSPLTGKPYQPDEIAFYNSVIPAEKRRNIVRVERLFDSLVEEALPFGEFIAEFHKRIDEQIKEENAIALKTVIAYYGGLEVEVVDDNSAKTAYENYLKDPTNKVVSKRIHDYMVAMGLDACKRNDIPMQIHTGMGECTMINMFTLSPAYLYPLFTDPRVFKQR